MMVFRTETRQVDPSLELSRCLTMPADDADARTSRLLAIGSVESALSDLWAAKRDGRDPRVMALSAATRSAARSLVDGLAGDGATADAAERHFRRSVSACLRLPLPPLVDLRLARGFAYHGVHPLGYAAAATECLRRWRPSRVAVIGVRTIGSTLAAVVAACCEREGVPTWTASVRPHGDPLARECFVDKALASEIDAQRGALCLVVDEGPGASGASLASVAALLESHGHPATRIALVCSHDPAPISLRSDQARQRWESYGRVVAPLHRPAFLQDWSAGAWRQHLGLKSSQWPSVQPQLERHKGVPEHAPSELHKFVGLGAYGSVVWRRAAKAAETGFAVPVLGLRDGYLRMARLAPASVMTRRGTRALAEAMLRYLPWRAGAMQTGARADVDAPLEFLRVNTREHFGAGHDALLSRMEHLAHRSAAQPAIVIDGHLAPWEWLQTPQGIVKVDTAEHGDDQFQPGPQDIAWDVAAAVDEFAWTPAERASLIERLASALKDPSLTERLRWMRACYLAARLGYCSLAGETLGDTPDGRGFRRQTQGYARRLAGALAEA